MTIGSIALGWIFLLTTITLAALAFFWGRSRAKRVLQNSDAKLSSALNFYGYLPTLIVIGICAVVFGLTYIFGEGIVRHHLISELPDGFATFSGHELTQYLNQVSQSPAQSFAGYTENPIFAAISDRYIALKGQLHALALVLSIILAGLGALISVALTGPKTRVREYVEKIFEFLLLVCAGVAIVTTIGIVFSLLNDSWRFFEQYPVWKFLFGTEWNAQTEAASSFGAIPLFFGTVVVAIIAMTVALPVGVFSAVYLAEYATSKTRSWAKPTLEILAGIPTVVYGFFAILVISPVVQISAEGLNELIHAAGGSERFFSAASKNALSAGFVMGIMIVPFVSSLSDDVIRAVPNNIRDGALALGATKSESIAQVVLPSASPGIIAATLLAISRAIGETMIVVMAAGQSAQITSDLTAEITTVTVQIVASMTLDAEFDSATALSAFALGLVLFVFTLIFNLIAFTIVNNYRKRYA